MKKVNPDLLTIPARLHLWRRCFLFTVSCLAMTGTVSGEMESGAGDNGEAVAEVSEAPIPKESDAAALRLINNYLTASGGEAAHQRIQSIRATGVMREGRIEYDFEIIETSDGKRWFRQVWRNYEDVGRTYETLRVTDGTRRGTWIQPIRPRSRDPEPMPGGEAAFFAAHQWFFLPFTTERREGWVFTYEGTGKTLGRNTYIVRGHGPNGEDAWYYFDKETFLVIRHGGVMGTGGAQVPQDFAASSFRMRSGVHIPNGLFLMAQEGRYGSVTFQRIELNPRLDPKIFEEGQPSGEFWLRQR